MQPIVPEIITRAAYTIFGRPLVHPNYLQILVETIVATAICPEWEWKPSSSGDPGRLRHKDGTKAKVYEFTMIDHRGQFRSSPERWGLGRPYDAADAAVCFHKDPDLFILARHGETNLDLADHRDATQWRFYVLEASSYQGRSIELYELVQKTTAADIVDLPAALTWSREALRRRLADEERRKLDQKKRPLCRHALDLELD